MLKRFLIITALLAAGPAFGAERSHGLSTFGDLKYGPAFTHFEYAQPGAPRDGEIRTQGTGETISFDSLNGFILKGVPAQGLELLFDTLMVRAADEPDAMYGLVAAWAEVADDKMSVTFGLRQQARFADGTPLTAADVVESFTLLKTKGDPAYRFPLRDVLKAEALNAHTVRYTFTGTEVRDLPLRVASLPIFSAAYYAKHAFDETTLDAPLGSGPYRVADMKMGQFVSYERREDYWARDLPVNTGRWNFKKIRYEYFRDRSIAFEAFKAGALDLREEFTSKTWATEYDFPAVRDGRVIKEMLPDHTPSGTQAFFLNTRKAQLADIRVRRALDLAFDFEWTNRTLFHMAYKRTDSLFENSEMEARPGPPTGKVLALLEPFRDKLPPEVFEDRYHAPVTDGSGRDRNNLTAAAKLLDEAGWKIVGGQRMKDGQPLKLEFLMLEPSFERVIAPYIARLKRLGVQANMRIVDQAQYQARYEAYDFDTTTARFTIPNTPGVELRFYLGANAAATPGSYNLAGISDPVVDALVEKVVGAKSRDDLIAATRALDRVVMLGHYMVPHWYKASHSVAYYNRFGRPATKPHYARGILDLWWVDPAKDAALNAKQKGAN